MAHDHFTAPSISNFLEIDPNNIMDHFHFPDHPNPIVDGTSSIILPPVSAFQNHPMSFPEFPGILGDAFPGIFFHPGEQFAGIVPNSALEMGTGLCDPRKRKVPDVSESSSGVSSHSPPVSASGANRKTESSGRAKRMKKRSGKLEEEEEEEKPKEVVHVRARRGQATDSHSLAERVRRGKINERLKCLQDIVPGCYKTMGLAVMLDEIINYVQSLQNQVEFLSMKLTAASSYYDFNSESDAIDKMQRAMAGEAKELQRISREGSSGGGNQPSNFHSSSWQP